MRLAFKPRVRYGGAMNISFWRLGTRSLGRDLRSGELRLLIVAVTLAVAALTAVGFFADRLKGGLQRDARQLLGGDAVISSNNPTPAAFAAKARALGLEVVQTMSFPTMGRSSDANGGGTKLVALKVVEPGYPLRGRLTLASQPGAPEVLTRSIPTPGEAWIEASLLDALALKMGDELLLGEAHLRVAKIIVNEPDRGAGFMSFAPRSGSLTMILAMRRWLSPSSRSPPIGTPMASSKGASIQASPGWGMLCVNRSAAPGWSAILSWPRSG